ncbi:MAG: hypothetical protein C7N36_11125 [Bacteroidetes bacterium]|nr:MAG: hypothetical protein C7N36_11125 [Bacteroidota bacterium]
MKKIIPFLVLTAIFLISSCAKIYYSPDAKSRANSHSIIAIAPPKVSIAARKKVDAEAMKEQQRTESTNFQQEMYSWLLRRKMQNRFPVEMLDVETTNAKLRQAGYFDGTPMAPGEICALLGVDAVITSNYSLSKPMSDGAAVALGLLVGVWGSTNNTTVILEIHDKETKKLLWNYSHKVSGSVGSSPSQLVDNLMRNASKKMPYTD